MVYGDDMAVLVDQIRQHLFGIVRAPVVHKDYLVIYADLPERIGKPSIHMRNGLLIVITGDNSRDLFHMDHASLKQQRLYPVRKPRIF
jgi:hypothetical protein